MYDPTAGTGGMLSESEKFICGDGVTNGLNPDANIELFGQEYNPESYAICCSDLLIKDEPINNLIYGDTLGIKDAKNKTNGFVPHDGHPGKNSTTCWPIHLLGWSGNLKKIMSARNTTRTASMDGSAQACHASTTARCSFCST